MSPLSDPFGFDLDGYRQRLVWEFGLTQAVRDPRAHVTVKGITGDGPVAPRIGGIRAVESDFVDAIIVLDGRTIIVPAYNRYGDRLGLKVLEGPTPLWTRYTLGVREAARAQRQRRRGLR